MDLPLAEIAEAMGVPMGTVKSWIHRGLEREMASELEFLYIFIYYFKNIEILLP